MDKISFIEIVNPDNTVTEHAIIDKGNGEFLSMPKVYWDAQQEASGTLS